MRRAGNRFVPCSSPVLHVTACPWPWPTCPGSRKRPASAGVALTRRIRPRSWNSEEDGDHLLAEIVDAVA